MSSNYLTAHQRKVLQILNNGGSIVSVYDDQGWQHEVVDKNKNTSYTQGNTLSSLRNRGWIKDKQNFPVHFVTTWVITEEGKVAADKLSQSQPISQ
jgi:hypothetical protein